MICIGRHVGGHTLALQHGGKTTFCLYSVKRLIVMLRCVVNVATSFSLKFKCKICVQKEAIHNFTILAK